jgi:hypothetical protein
MPQWKDKELEDQNTEATAHKNRMERTFRSILCTYQVGKIFKQWILPSEQPL